jgi:hypothetical protein
LQTFSVVSAGLVLTTSLLLAGVRTLPPSAFPELPNAVMSELHARGCQIPQIHRHDHINAISGEFLSSGEVDWAVLCVTKQDMTVLVFAAGDEQSPMEVTKVRNGLYGDSSIKAMSRRGMLDLLTQWNFRRPLPQFEHEGILLGLGPRDRDSPRFSDNAAETSILYFDDGRWTLLVGTIVN